MSSLDEETVEFFRSTQGPEKFCKVMKFAASGYFCLVADTLEGFKTEYASWLEALVASLDKIKVAEKIKVKMPNGEIIEKEGPSFFTEKCLTELADLSTHDRTEPE